ncbi:Ig domain-containing protein [Rhodococcus sp. WMMA185]|uniref:Ig domain-containing protein n=1 Tax=Rhodococcus sp. WMMA185 TaxID=679318 RepID=UPI000AAF1788|nr:Ig domain-containing protein [Rhodococcus sp. WMMA185]
MTTPDPLRRTRRGRIAATLLAATAAIALAGGVGTASADTTVSYHARFCSDAKDGNTIAFQVNEGKPRQNPPEDTWHGQWISDVTFDTWVDDSNANNPHNTGRWCHTVVRTDLSEGDWVRLAGWNPSSGIATRLTEVVEVNGVVFERLVSGEAWWMALQRCCGAHYATVPAPTIPDLVDPAFVDTTSVALTGTVGTSLTRTFTATGTPDPVVTVVDPAKLPPGMTFANDPATGLPTLSGTPTAAGSYPFTLTADNGVGAPVRLTATVTVEAPATGSLGSLGSIFGS